MLLLIGQIILAVGALFVVTVLASLVVCETAKIIGGAAWGRRAGLMMSTINGLGFGQLISQLSVSGANSLGSFFLPVMLVLFLVTQAGMIVGGLSVMDRRLLQRCLTFGPTAMTVAFVLTLVFA